MYKTKNSLPKFLTIFNLRRSRVHSHKEAVWCDECQAEWKCRDHIVRSWCSECNLRWNCDVKYKTHMHQEHKLECDICQSKFAKESTIKYHNQEWYCEACDSNFKCENEFKEHAELDHRLVKKSETKLDSKDST